jgi:hypothetical protein
VADLNLWSEAEPTPMRPAAVAVPVGPPPLPPSLEDLEAVERYVETVRRLVQTPHRDGKPFHTLFDDQRIQVVNTKLREANLLAERLIRELERSRDNKELLWHLMVARKNEEIHRKRR